MSPEKGVWTFRFPWGAADGAVGGLGGGPGMVCGRSALDDTCWKRRSASSLLRQSARAEALAPSGVIAVCSPEIVLGQMQHRSMRPETGFAARAVWEFLEFILNSLVFHLIGLQLNPSSTVWMAAPLGRSPHRRAIAIALIAPASFGVLYGFAAGLVPSVRRRTRADPGPGHGHLLVGGAGDREPRAALALPLDFPSATSSCFLPSPLSWRPWWPRHHLGVGDTKSG